MAREVLGGLVAPFDLLPPTAEHLPFVGEENLLEPGDAIVDPGDADFLALGDHPDNPLDVDDPVAVQNGREDLEIVGGCLLASMGHRYREPRPLLALARRVNDPDRLRRHVPPDRLVVSIHGAFVGAVEGELVSSIQEASAAGRAGRPVEHAVVVSKAVDFLVQVIRREDREAGVADTSIAGLSETLDGPLVRPLMGVVLVIERLRDSPMFLVGAGEFVGSGAVLLDQFELLRGEVR